MVFGCVWVCVLQRNGKYSTVLEMLGAVEEVYSTYRLPINPLDKLYCPYCNLYSIVQYCKTSIELWMKTDEDFYDF